MKITKDTILPILGFFKNVHFRISICLMQVCKKKVNIHEVSGDHRQILTGESAKRVADILSHINL